jgi:hypothetical protein
MKSRPSAGIFAALALWVLAACILVACGGGSGGSAAGSATTAGSGTGSAFGNAVVSAGGDTGPGGTDGSAAGGSGAGGTAGSAGGAKGDGTGVADAGGICGGGSGGGIGGTGSPASVGGIHFYLTDAPACGYDHVHVTVQQVRVHQTAAAAGSDAGWSQLVLDQPRRIDLLTLTNGALADLGEIALPPGRYTQLRLVLAENDGAEPFANAVVPTGGSAAPLDTPSGAQSGIKLGVDIDVAAGQTTDVVLDFNACKSVVSRGKSGQFNLKPFITVLPSAASPGLRVTGSVAPALASSATQVSLQRNGVPVRATHPDADGRFVLSPVPAGTYDLVITAPGHATAVVTDVPVDAAQPTRANPPEAPIGLPKSALRSVSGSVTPASASVRAVQTLADGRRIEAAWAPVDPSTGSFVFALPSAPSSTAAYAAGGALAFLAEPAPGYSIEAESAGVTRTQAIDVTAPVAPLAIAFP